MSAFLGPIHSWMFKNILIVESRAFAIASAAGNGNADSVQKILNEYGEKLEGRDLEELVGNNPVHQAITGLLAKTQVLEAQIVAAIDGNFDEALKTAHSHGRDHAAKLIEAKGVAPSSVEEIQAYIRDNQLEGMPCDPGAMFEPLENGSIMYLHSSCNHMQNWQYTDADPAKLCKLTCEWLQGFVEGLNGAAKLSVEKTIAAGADSCAAKIHMPSA